MLLIQSKETDLSTSMVIQWLMYHDVKFQRINGETNFLSCDFELNQNGALGIILKDRDGNKFDFSKYTAFWYRRGDWHIARPNLERFKEQTLSILNHEWENIKRNNRILFRKTPLLGEH